MRRFFCTLIFGFACAVIGAVTISNVGAIGKATEGKNKSERIEMLERDVAKLREDVNALQVQGKE